MYSILLLIVQFIYILVYNIIKRLAIQSVKNSGTADESCQIRKQFQFARIMLAVLYGLASLSLIYASNSVMSSCFIGIVIAFQSFQKRESFPMSGKRPVDLKDRVFALYLRGFSQDDYETTVLGNINSKDNSFSEGLFISYVSKYIPVYAIGMTKELGSPLGAKRIYLNDNTWKDELIEIIEKSSLIFIRLHNSESCIWEILNTITCKDKIVYISDDDSLYNIREHLNKKQAYGVLPICLNSKCITWLNNGEEIIRKDTFKGETLRATIQLFMYDKLQMKRILISGKVQKVIMYMLIFLLLIVTETYNIFIANLNRNLDGTLVQFISVFEAVILTICIYYIPYVINTIRLRFMYKSQSKERIPST